MFSGPADFSLTYILNMYYYVVQQSTVCCRSGTGNVQVINYSLVLRKFVRHTKRKTETTLYALDHSTGPD